jgi:hypothetical protein
MDMPFRLREIRQTVLENPSNVPGADTFRSFALPIAMRQSGQTAGSLGFEIAGTEIVHPIRAGGRRTALKTALSSTLSRRRAFRRLAQRPEVILLVPKKNCNLL